MEADAWRSDGETDQKKHVTQNEGDNKNHVGILSWVYMTFRRVLR